MSVFTGLVHSACGWIFYFANIVILFAMIIMLFAVEKGILAWYNNDEMLSENMIYTEGAI